MNRWLPLACFSFALTLSACEEKGATVSPDEAPAQPLAEPEPEPEPEGASPELVASYTAVVHDVYSSDAARCLEDQMDAEDSKYMRAGYTLTIGVAVDGTTENVAASEVMVQIRNYGGKVLREGNAESMGACLVEAASAWEFEPVPPSATSFQISGTVGD
jgi:hypothetical protein